MVILRGVARTRRFQNDDHRIMSRWEMMRLGFLDPESPVDVQMASLGPSYGRYGRHRYIEFHTHFRLAECSEYKAHRAVPEAHWEPF